MSLERYLPVFDWGRRYDRAALTGDLVAAVIVTIMLIPQSLAYAMLAGLPPVAGLYASILPLALYAIFGTSRSLAVGPVAVISLLTASAAGAVAVPGSAAYIEATVALALLSGAILLAMGLFRLGFLANLLSHPVISGFITASGLLIAASQVRHVLGVSAGGGTFPETIQALLVALPETNWPTLVIGGATIGFLFYARSRLPYVLRRAGMPERRAALLARTAPVVAVVLSILAVILLGLAGRGVAVVGDVPRGLPPLSLPGADLALWARLLPAAFLISVVGFVESVSVAQTLAAKKRQSIRPDQELIGIGMANLAAAVSAGYPVTGGFARSVVNHDAGAETPAAGAYTAIGIALASLFLTPLLRNLPVAVLAATIIVAVLSLVDFGALLRTWRYSRIDFIAMAGTILVTLGVGVEAGILAGVSLSLLLHLWRGSRPHVAEIGQVPGTRHFRNRLRHDVAMDPSVLSLRIDSSIWFGNARAVEDVLQDAVAGRHRLRHLVLNCAAVNSVDASALESLERSRARLADQGIALHLSEVKGPVMDRLARTDFIEHLGGTVFLSHHEAMTALAPDMTALADAAPRPVIDARRPSPERPALPD
ncbi:sulfate permease [Roseicyclus sp. F158]|uniref:Sulfate permease n=1 Tax=Tropicimonas omnivorans TaxID=3075590 RepID=A0ABU3DHR5_9RHOB|nr:sulfate permease [Roseicyclus sp. F158]MDT0683239.1 sulfate permease [Roseicyclus sp. F158]